MAQVEPDLTGVVLDAPDPQELAAFYERLLGRPREQDEPDRVRLRSPRGGAGLSFQREPEYRRPVWPGRADEPGMMAHLDIRADDREAALGHALSVGAVLADHQPQDDVRVRLDPAGPPFCLWAD